MKNKTSILVGTRHFFYALLVAVIFCGCEDEKKKTQEPNNIIITKDYTTYIIDSCEYIGNSCVFSRGVYSSNLFLTHKGNCKFCAERSKK